MAEWTVSFIVVAKQAARYLPDLYEDLLAQEYPAGLTEVILVAGPSEDNTLERMEQFRAAHPERRILVLHNPKGILASGWNVALAQATGDVILRVDAHARFSPVFVSHSVEALRNGADVAGGCRRTVLPDKPRQRFLAIAERSKFGCGSADYRNAREAGYVDTLAHAAYRRDVFKAVGGYDERLVRTEDNEMHFRMKQAGYRFYYSPEIESLHFARPELRAMMRQKYGNGLWIGLTMGIAPRCFSVRHFIPAGFVLFMAAGVLAGFTWSWWPLVLGLILYGFAAFAFAVRETVQPEAAGCRIFCPLLPALFFLIHFFYGIGTIWGLLKMPAFTLKNRSYRLPRPVGEK